MYFSTWTFHLPNSGNEKQTNKATKRSRTNTPTNEDTNGGDLAGMLKPMDDDDTEDQVSYPDL